MKNHTTDFILLIIAWLLMWILIEVGQINVKMDDWRPVRTYHYSMNYDVEVRPGANLAVYGD